MAGVKTGKSQAYYKRQHFCKNTRSHIILKKEQKQNQGV